MKTESVMPSGTLSAACPWVFSRPDREGVIQWSI
jgi:hypothetical protein